MKQHVSMQAVSILLSLLVLTGCWGPKVHRPTSAAGAICAEQCDQQRYSCNNVAQAAAAGSQSSCESRQAYVERHCEPWVKDKEKQRCQVANNPGGLTCTASVPDYGGCTGTWQGCIVSCGGYLE